MTDKTGGAPADKMENGREDRVKRGLVMMIL